MQLFASTNHDQDESFNNDSILAINRGAFYGENFNNHLKNCSECVIETNLAVERINLVKKGRVDFAVEELLAGIYIINQQKLNQYVQPINTTINSNPVYYMLNPERFSAKEVEKLNKAIEQNDEAINKLVESYHEMYSELYSE